MRLSLLALLTLASGASSEPIFHADFEEQDLFTANAYASSSDGHLSVERGLLNGRGQLIATIDGDGLEGDNPWFGAASQWWGAIDVGDATPQQLKLTARVSVPEGGPTGPVVLSFKDEETGATWSFRATATEEFRTIGGMLDDAAVENPAPLTPSGNYSIFVAFAETTWNGWSGEPDAINTLLFDDVKLERVNRDVRLQPASEAAASTKVAPKQPMPTYGEWHQSRLGGGGYWMGVVPTRNADVFYTFSDVGGAWRSDDGGRSWRSLNRDLGGEDAGSYVRSLDVDPRDENVLLMASGSQWYTGGGLYRSTDAGKTWQQVVETPVMGNEEARMAGTTIARSPTNPDRLVFASAGNVRVSLDGGMTWSTVGDGLFGDLFPSVVAFDAASPDRVLVGGQDGENYVGGWSPEGPKQYLGGLWLSEDAGETWQQVSDEDVVELAQLPGDEAIYGVFNYDTVRRSTDGGETWSELRDGLPAPTGDNIIGTGRLQGLTAGPSFLLTINGQGDVYRLGSGESRWQQVRRMHVADDGWYGNVPGEERKPGSHEGWVHFGKAAAFIGVDPTNADRWFMTDWYAVWRSEDAGRTWAISIDGLENTVSHDLAGQPGSPDVVHWGMGDNGYLRSGNGGRSFIDISFPANGGGSNVKDFGQSPADPQRLYATTNKRPGEWEAAQLAVSDDAGKTWRNPTMAGLPSDMGETRRMNSVTVCPNDADRILVGVSGNPAERGGAYESRDAGETFRKLGSGLPANEFGTYFQTNVWAVGNELSLSGDGSAVAFSQDGRFVHRLDGSTWTPVDHDFGGQPYEVVADPRYDGRFYLAVVGSGLWRSVDGGVSWDKLWNGSAYHVAIDGERIAVGHETGIVVFDGESWTEVAADLPVRRRPIPAFAGDRLHAGTHNMGSFWRELKRR
ncbi:MAG: hypothetical protein AAF561_02005 [Planctomycetota bacterium]